MLEIDVWHSELNTDNAQSSQDWRVLDSHEKIQAEKFSNLLLQQRYVAAHGRLRDILAQYLPQSPANIHIKKAALGKPYLADYPELAFNLSHTGNSMAVAVAKNCQIGIDIEQCKHRTSLAALVHKCFSDEEATHWQQLPEAEQQRAFYQFWTRKEAFVKATGLGITVGLHDCVINPDNPRTFLAVPKVCGAAHTWHNRDIDLGQGMCAALVANKSITTVNLRNESP